MPTRRSEEGLGVACPRLHRSCSRFARPALPSPHALQRSRPAQTQGRRGPALGRRRRAPRRDDERALRRGIVRRAHSRAPEPPWPRSPSGPPCPFPPKEPCRRARRSPLHRPAPPA